MASLALGLFACTTTSEPEDEAADTGSEFDQGAQAEVEVEEVEDSTVSATQLEIETVYFDFDKSSIRADARPVLRAGAEKLRATNVPVRLEGYCDERGDEEYNLALGERRANSVKKYLENLGVPSSQMRTLSYGEAKPAVQGHDEAAWRYNRRVEFHVRR